MIQDFERKTVVVTGAASLKGIGASSALRLAKAGWNIGLLDQDSEALAETAQYMRQHAEVQVYATAADITDRSAVEKAIEDIRNSLPPILGVVNSAGVASGSRYLDMGDEEWENQIKVNLFGTHYVTQSCIPDMMEASWGRVVNVSSVSAMQGGGRKTGVAYSASKAALLGFGKALAREVGNKNITVNTIAPGPIKTQMLGEVTEDHEATLSSDGVTPYIGTGDNVASAIEYLFTESARFITGHTLHINGGLYMA